LHLQTILSKAQLIQVVYEIGIGTKWIQVPKLLFRIYGFEQDKIYSIYIKEGRWFRDDNSDKKNYILNETAVGELGIREPVVGQVFARQAKIQGK